MRSAGQLHDFRKVFLVRVACAPSTVLGAFGNPGLADTARQALGLREEFHRAAAALDAALIELRRHNSDRRQQRSAAKLRRALANPDLFLERAQEGEAERWLCSVGAQFDRTRTAALDATRAASAFEKAWTHQLAHEQESLRDALELEDIQKGILYSSDGLSAQLRRYLAGTAGWKPSRLRKFEEAAVTYVGRAIAKTSPFSTFTAVSWGQWTDNRCATTLDTDSESLQRRRSSIRLHRAALHRLILRLLSAQPVHQDHIIRPNPTIVRTAGEIAFYRARPRTDRVMLHYVPPVEDVVRLPRRRAIDLILEQFDKAGGLLSLGELVAALARLSDVDQVSIGKYVERALEMHVLEIVTPVSEHDPNYDASIAAWLANHPDRRMRWFGDELKAAVRTLKLFGSADAPVRANIQHEAKAQWANLERAAELEPIRQVCFFEDVAVRGADFSLWSGLLDEIRDDLWSFGRISALFQPGYRLRARMVELLNTVHGGEAPLLELFASYEEFRRSGETGLSALEKELDGVRAEARRAVRTAVPDGDGCRVVDWRLAESLLGPLPTWFEPPPSMGFFLQRGRRPRDPWIVNLLVDGNGRFYSRFLHLLPSLQRAAKVQGTSHDTAAELIDMGAVFACNVNLHVPLTRQAFDYPGHCHPKDWASVSLTDLIVRVDAACVPRLFRRGDRRANILPMHFGFLVLPWLPSLARFLACLGPLGPKPLPWHDDILPGGASTKHMVRLYWGNVLLYRQRWNLFPTDLESIIQGTELEALAAIAAIRHQCGLPRRVFATVDRMQRSKRDRQPKVKTAEGSRRGDNLGRKPHFLDLTSPLYLPRLRRLASSVAHCMSLEEIYPRLDETLTTDGKDHYAVELFTEISPRDDDA